MEPTENVCERRRIHGLVMISPSHTHTHSHTCVKLAIYYTFFHCVLTDKKKPNEGDGGAGVEKGKGCSERQIERRVQVCGPQMPHAGVHQPDEPP
jgi:hypothetical protein